MTSGEKMTTNIYYFIKNYFINLATLCFPLFFTDSYFNDIQKKVSYAADRTL